MKKKFKENSLFHFIEDQVKNLSELYSIKYRAYSVREVFYMDLREELTISSELWQFDESHFSVEKRVLPYADFMSPSHLTLTLKHKTLVNTLCRIHVYLDEMLNSQARIQVKELRETAESTDVIKVEEIDQLTVTSDKIVVEGTNLSLKMVKTHLEKHVPILNELMQKKLMMYMQFKQEITESEQELNRLIRNIDISKANLTQLNQLKKVCESYLAQVKIFNRYSDSEQDQAEHFLKNLRTHLENQITQSRTQPTESKESKEPTSKETQSLSESARAPLVTSSALSTERKSSQIKQLKKLMSFSKVDNVVALPAHSELYLNLVNDLTIFSFEELTRSDRTWVNHSLKTLDDVKCIIIERYSMKALAGDLDAVKALESQTGFKFDMLAFYSELLNLIETNTISKSKQRDLIAIADYFYQSSDIYRAFVRYYMIYRREIFKLSDELGEMNITSLIKTFIINNYPAFELYVRQAGEVNAIHLSYAKRGVNALQGIALMNHGTFDTRPYVQLLIRHGAVLETIQALSPVVSYEVKASEKKVSTSDKCLSIFELMRDNPKALKFKKRDFRYSPSRELVALLKDLENANQMISFILKTNLLRDSGMLLTISEHVNIKTLLMSLVSAAMYTFCNLSMVPTRRPGIHFYPQRVMQTAIEETNQLMDKTWSAAKGDDPALTFAVMGFVIREESKESRSEINHYLDATNGMVRQLEMMLKKTTADEISKLITELNKDVLPHLVRKPKIASEYYMALIILKSYHVNKRASDFQELFIYVMRFATLKDRIIKQDMGVNTFQVLEKMCIKLKIMLGLINPAMHEEILSHTLLAQLKE